jgi:hypothetical protein
VRDGLADRDGPPRLWAGLDECRDEIRADRVVQAKQPTVAQLQHEHRGELLGDRGEPEDRVRPEGDVVLLVGLAGGETRQHLPTPNYQHRPGEPFLRGQIPQVRLHSRSGPITRRCR